MRLLACLLLLGFGAPAEAQCRLALALGLDVSGSVDETEYRLQIDGVAAALSDSQVQDAFLMLPDAPVRLMVFEWSAMDHQRQILSWTEIRSADDLNQAARQLLDTRPVAVPHPSTAIGVAMRYGARELAAQDCWERTLDISGDGPANVGVHPMEVTEANEITINGLVVGPRSPSNINKNRAGLKTLQEYYELFVLRGPGAFVEPAEDFTDFAQAMQRKLLRELRPANLSALPFKQTDPG